MIEAIGSIALGLVLLAGGGEALLRGAVAIASLLRLPPAIIGLTVVAAGPSFPELSVSVLAALKEQPDIAVGNVVGSNIFTVTFVLGICALVRPLAITGNSIRLEYPVLAIVTLMTLAVAQDGTINALDGLLFVSIYVLFTTYMVTLVRGQVDEAEAGGLAAEVQSRVDRPRWLPTLVWLVGGTAALGLGATLTVNGAIGLAQMAGLSERVIGLTIVAAGTSLPEVVATLVSTVRGRDDVAIGNVIGSNIFNILGILGLSSLFSPLPVHESIIGIDNLWMMGTTVLLFPLMFTRLRIDRWEGAILLSCYIAYTASLFARPA